MLTCTWAQSISFSASLILITSWYIYLLIWEKSTKFNLLTETSHFSLSGVLTERERDLQEAVRGVVSEAVRANALTTIKAKNILFIFLLILVNHAGVEEFLIQKSIKPPWNLWIIRLQIETRFIHSNQEKHYCRERDRGREREREATMCCLCSWLQMVMQ